MEKEKNTYIPPILTVVEFKTERGYAASSDNLVINAQQAIQLTIDREIASQQMGELGANGNVVAGQMDGNYDYSGGGAGTGWQYDNGAWF